MRLIKEKIMQKDNNNEEQDQSTSGNKDEKRDSKQGRLRSILKSGKQKPEEKPEKEKDKPFQQHQRRRSSAEQTLRYKIPPRVEGPQQSHSIRNLIPRSTSPVKKVKEIKVHIDEPSTSSSGRDHHEAVEFYNRSTGYGYTRESLLNLRGAIKKELPFKNWHRHHRSPEPSTTSRLHHVRRCIECLQAKNECMCETMPPKPQMSDWATMVTPQFDSPKTFTTPRLTWLNDVEKHSKIDQPKLIETKFNKSREVCCFPFGTFGIFAKQDIKTVDFYEKN